MKYIKEERLVIGKKIYDGECSRYEAAEEFGISDQTARDYMRLYRTLNQLPPRNKPRGSHLSAKAAAAPSGTEAFEAMSKEELIHELVKAKIVEARLKKGYEVKGDGPQKEYIPLGSKSTK
ncbi:MAG: hypothetical protein AB9880_00655 [Christensenellales bacterium]